MAFDARVNPDDPAVPLQTITADPTDLNGYIAALSQVMEGTASFLPVPPAITSVQHRANAELAAAMRVGSPITAGTLIACTSGSTGTPKGAMLSAENLRSSNDATAYYLRKKYGVEPGAWLLTLPAHHIAGTQVILRSLSAGCTPIVASHLAGNQGGGSACHFPRTSTRTETPARVASGSFTVEGFSTDTRTLRQLYPDRHLYTSLVPAQLERLVADPAGVEALRMYATILIGGAATRSEVISTIDNLGVHFALTYGSSETSGGCVYDGCPLPGVTVAVEDPGGQRVEVTHEDFSMTRQRKVISSSEPTAQRGRIVLSGPMVSRGYRNLPDSSAFPQAGTFVTSDLGEISAVATSFSDAASPSNTPPGILRVIGRADGAINTGGYKVLPEDVERAIHTHLPELVLDSGHSVSTTTLCVVGVDDKAFGQIVAVAIEGGVEKEELTHAHGQNGESGAEQFKRSAQELKPNTLGMDVTGTLRAALRGHLPTHLIPRRALLVPALPTSGPGKVSRRGVAQLFTD
ncbi:AMP-binding protein [Corynebacterium anserum]|uniref:AMP-binding protein n=1 Tax=Corynebacterium anserum TaxID=2684406 RepID=A0A7G7YQ55_9CORY|nr:AMP-binding protein [Corynebacterium anserum]QNH96625.1 AMP-binding protein [Corynebacterium anserum]